MEVKGKVIQIMPAETIGASGKSKQAFILETEGQYPKKIAVDVWEDKVAMAMGESVELSVNVESREYNGKWFTNISAWSKKGASQGQSQGATLSQPSAPVQSGPPPAIEPDDIPF
jgi:hypothetical protein